MSKLHDDDLPRDERDVIGSSDAPDASEAGASELAAGLEALRAAYAPRELDPDAHEALLARALGVEPGELDAGALEELALPHEVSAEPDRAERKCAEALRAALDGEPSTPEALALVEVARALRYAHEPPALVEIRHEALLRGALGRPSKLRTITTGIVGALAAAAAAVGALSLEPQRDAPSAALVPARSTLELFDPAEPFPRSGEETSRIDRIAGARAADLRRNRYATWGVR